MTKTMHKKTAIANNWQHIDRKLINVEIELCHNGSNDHFKWHFRADNEWIFWDWISDLTAGAVISLGKHFDIHWTKTVHYESD